MCVSRAATVAAAAAATAAAQQPCMTTAASSSVQVVTLTLPSAVRGLPKQTTTTTSHAPPLSARAGDDVTAVITYGALRYCCTLVAMRGALLTSQLPRQRADLLRY